MMEQYSKVLLYYSFFFLLLNDSELNWSYVCKTNCSLHSLNSSHHLQNSFQVTQPLTHGSKRARSHPELG